MFGVAQLMASEIKPVAYNNSSGSSVEEGLSKKQKICVEQVLTEEQKQELNEKLQNALKNVDFSKAFILE